jgi:ABC-type nitrate/sulfonate/bicarbonate transport system ATPase subunit
MGHSFDSTPAPTSSSRLSVSRLSKNFPSGDGTQIVAIADMSFEVRDNEFLSIVGPSGCGKSTLLNVLAGLEEPSGGDILVDGRQHAQRGAFFGYMFQKDLLLPWRNIVENVALSLEVQRVPRQQARARALQLLERFGLARFSEKYPIQLSGGMRQRVALMRTLICDRPILLLDEPFGALDALTRSVMQEWLLETWEADRRTVVFITHDVEESIFLSDRVLVMTGHPGRIKRELKVDFARPRNHVLLTEPRFSKLKHQVLSELYDESVKALVAEEE